MANYKVSPSVIKRLPRYYRFLGELHKNNVSRISSGSLAAKMGLTASQIRQDLNCFGGFGQQGYGYNVLELYNEIGEILGLNKRYNAIIIGAGNLGRAIATHMAFEKRGFNLIGIFDKKESIAGQMVKGMPVRHISGLDDFCRSYNPKVAVLCIPQEEAEKTIKQLLKLKISGFWNFSHYDFNEKFPDVTVENVHLSDSLMTFCYKIKENEEN
ncbi:MAG: redox-sensing transcriptional repressor Rex [Acutalibacteraceae bacterium]